MKSLLHTCQRDLVFRSSASSPCSVPSIVSRPPDLWWPFGAPVGNHRQTLLDYMCSVRVPHTRLPLQRSFKTADGSANPTSARTPSFHLAPMSALPPITATCNCHLDLGASDTCSVLWSSVYSLGSSVLRVTTDDEDARGLSIMKLHIHAEVGLDRAKVEA